MNDRDLYALAHEVGVHPVRMRDALDLLGLSVTPAAAVREAGLAEKQRELLIDAVTAAAQVGLFLPALCHAFDIPDPLPARLAEQPAVREAGLDVERLALAVSRAVVEADRLYSAGYSMTGDLVPLIASEYLRLGSDEGQDAFGLGSS